MLYGMINMSYLKNLLLVEGETEEKFLKDFKSNLKIQTKIKIFNLAQNDFKLNIYGKRYNIVSVILDSDIFNKDTISRINKNLKMLNANKINIYIQNKNFEDELAKSLEECKRTKDLYRLFGCEDNSSTEFKRKFLKVSDLSLKNNFKVNFYKLYCNNNEFNKKIKVGKIQTGKQLFRKEFI